MSRKWRDRSGSNKYGRAPASTYRTPTKPTCCGEHRRSPTDTEGAPTKPTGHRPTQKNDAPWHRKDTDEHSRPDGADTERAPKQKLIVHRPSTKGAPFSWYGGIVQGTFDPRRASRGPKLEHTCTTHMHDFLARETFGPADKHMHHTHIHDTQMPPAPTRGSCIRSLGPEFSFACAATCACHMRRSQGDM